MIAISIGGKYLAAKATQKTFRFTKEEGSLIFGLSSASAAATLASVMVGYNIIISENEAGEPIRLLNEHVLNGSILLILFSCTLSSFVSMRNAEKIAEAEKEDTITGNNPEQENILLALNHAETVEQLVNLATMIKTEINTDKLFALNIINEDKNESSEKNAEKILNNAIHSAAAADVTLNRLVRYDNDVINGINNVIKEKKITDLLIGLQQGKGFSQSFAYNLYNGYLQNENTNILVYHAVQPIATIKKHIVIIPPKMHTEPGFFYALLRIWNIARSSGAVMHFNTGEEISDMLRRIIKKVTIEAEFNRVESWQQMLNTIKSIDDNEGLIMLMPKRNTPAYLPQMRRVPELLNEHFTDKNYLLIYPYPLGDEKDAEIRSIANNRDFINISNIISKIFK